VETNNLYQSSYKSVPGNPNNQQFNLSDLKNLPLHNNEKVLIMIIGFPACGKSYLRNLLLEKINNQIAFMLSLQIGLDEGNNPTYKAISYGVNAMEDYKRKIRKEEAEIIADIAPSLRGWEGAASKKYFQLFICVFFQISLRFY
jgi:predicted AAA+ superfamily ATPase